MANVFNIPQLLELTFGVKPLEFDMATRPQDVRTAALGSPFYATDMYGREYFMPARLGGILLPYPLVRISGRKIIVDTPLVNRRGSVRELITLDDYRIDIRGLMIGPDNQWPEDQVTALRDLYERNEAITLECALTDIFLAVKESSGKDKVVIRGFDVLEARGAQNVAAYQMELVSDQELTLIAE